MNYYFNLNKLKISKLNKNSYLDMFDFYNIATKIFPHVFIPKDGSKILEGKTIQSYDNILFLENENNERVGCAVLKNKHIDFEKTEISKKNVLMLAFLMIKPSQQGKGYGTKLLNSVVKYARVNGFDYVELINNVNISLVNNLIYEKCGFNKYENLEAKSPNHVAFAYRIDTNRDYVDLSKAIYKTFCDLKKGIISERTERFILNTLEKNYVDVVKPQTQNEIQRAEKIKSGNVLQAASFGVRDMLHYTCGSAEKVALTFKTHAILKKTLPNLKSVKFMSNNILSYELRDIESLTRIFTSVNDIMVNESINKTVKPECVVKK